MSKLPPINGLLHIEVSGNLTFRSRVEDIDGTVFSLAAPIGAGDLELPEPGADLGLVWLEPGKRWSMPVRLLAVSRGIPSVWKVEPTGPADLSSRRNFVRGGGGGAAVVRRTTPPITEDVGTIVDVSEGGVRCRMPTGDFVQQDSVRVQLAIGDRILEVPGAVLSVRPNREEHCLDVVVTYELKEAEASIIRRHIFAWELEQRRRAREVQDLG